MIEFVFIILLGKSLMPVFGRKTISRFALLWAVIVLAVGIAIVRISPWGKLEATLAARSTNHSDINGNGVVDLEDVKLFSIQQTGQDYLQTDWCEWMELHASGKFKKYSELYAFMYEYFDCDGGEEPPPEGPLDVKNANLTPTRLAWGPDGYLYVSNTRLGSVFIYDPNLIVVGELKGLSKPLGIAVDGLGNMYVGSNGNNRVEVYDPLGTLIDIVGAGQIDMPNDIAFDNDGNMYVVDSKSNLVRVYDSNNTQIRTITDGNLNFPVPISVSYRDDGTGQMIGEVFVGDQGNHKVKVFDLEGNLLRSFSSVVSPGFMGMGLNWKGKNMNMVSFAVDAYGRLHVLDSYLCKVQVLDRDSGLYITYYGDIGEAPGQIRRGLGLDINQLGQAAIANQMNQRVEILYTVP